MSWIANIKNFDHLKDGTEYIKAVYGKSLAYLPDYSPEIFLSESEYYDNFGYGKCYGLTSSSVQYELATGKFDLKSLSYEKRLAWHFKEFCCKTSAHGIPMIGRAQNKCYRIMWVLLFLGCWTMLYYNADSVLDKYHRSEKIVDIQLKFDTAPFPVITLCNLNPYKASLATDVDVVHRMLTAFDGALNKASRTLSSNISQKKRRNVPQKVLMFEPGHSKCKCDDPDDTKSGCEGEKYKYEQPKSNHEKCICAFDKNTKDAWPCYLHLSWSRDKCQSCDSRAFCERALTTNMTGQQVSGIPCICAPSGVFCVAYDGDSEIINI